MKGLTYNCGPTHYERGNQDNHYKFRKSKPIHKARWMGKLLYCLKLGLGEKIIIDKLPCGSIFEDGQSNKVNRFVTFIAFVYIPCWFSCSNSCDVTVNDIDLIKELHALKKVDRII